MAISGGDGSIILTTKIDESGITKGTNSIKNAFDKVKIYLGKVGTQIGTGFQKVGNSIKNTFQKLGTYLKGFAGQILGLLSLRAFINFSREAGQMATQQEANVQRLIDIYGEASQSVGDYIDANARALGMSRSAAAQFSAVYGNLFSVWADQKTNAELTAQYLNMTAVVASKSGRTVEDVQERVRSGLLGNTEAIEDLGVFVNVKTIEMTDAFKRMADGRSWEQLGAYEQQQIRTMAILEQATQKYGTTVANTTALTRAQYKAAYEDMQATWGQFVNVVLMPVLKVVTQIMNIITAGLRAIAGITGKTIETSQIQSATANDTANAIGGAVDNQEALTDATKKTAKEQKKLLAGFDDIQILSQNAAESGGAGAGAGAVGGGVADLGLTGGGGTGGQEEGISTMLATIMGIVGGAMVALGVLLIFNGHIGWGIGFIIAGAATMGVSMAAVGGANLGIAEQFSSIMAIVGGFILAIGIVLLLKVPSAQPLALGMIIAGAGVLAVGVAQIAANKLGDEAKNTLHGIITIVSGFTLAIGIILLCFGQISPLSIGLVVTGAVGLATEIALYPDAVKEALQGWVGGVLAIVSGALLVLGIVLCVCGIVTPLSIGMIVVGAVGLVAELALNWNAIKEKTVEIFNNIMDWVKTWGLLILGIILVVSGVGMPLGIALMKKGGANLTEAQDPLWTAIVDRIKETWNAIKIFWNTHIAKWFTKEHWADLGKKMMNGLIEKIEEGINKILEKFHNANIGKAIDFVAGGLGFDIPKSVYIPRLARGAVIPPNREFLAVLGDQKHGTNIEAPLQTIVDAFNIALQNNGGGQTTKEEHWYVGETEIMSLIYRLVKGGERLRGNSLISSGGMY